MLNVGTWRDILDGDERTALRALLPDPAAPEADVEALLTRLFAAPRTGGEGADTACRDGGGGGDGDGGEEGGSGSRAEAADSASVSSPVR